MARNLHFGMAVLLIYRNSNKIHNYDFKYIFYLFCYKINFEYSNCLGDYEIIACFSNVEGLSSNLNRLMSSE